MQSDWQKPFFRGIALDAWRYIASPELTRQEADFLEQALAAPTGGRLLDIACGNGRHCVELAKRGYRMTGMDQSEEFLEEAHRADSASVRWVQADMRSLPLTGDFDGAFCWGNSFAFLAPEEARRFLQAIAASLKPGGKFIVDTGMAAESLLPSLARNRWFRLGDMLMLSENRYDPVDSRLDIDYTFVRAGQMETRPTSSYVLTSGELCRMHRDAGLTPANLFGSTAREPYQIGSPRLILVSVKQ